jgi:ferrous iron transport protein A
MINMAPLWLLSAGEKAEVMLIKTPKREGSNTGGEAGDPKQTAPDAMCHVEDMGLRTGKIIEMLKNEGWGPILVKVDESRIAISRGVAMQIMVRRID